MTDPLAGEIALLELDAHRRGGGEAETLRLASAPVLTRSDDDPSSTDYAPDLRDGVHLAGLQLHDDSNGYLHLGGRIVVPELSAVTLANYAEPDGGAWRGRHDRMVDHVFDDRPVDVRTLPQERDADWQLRPAPFADAVSVWRGVGRGRPEVSETEAVVALRSPLVRLDQPARHRRFLGLGHAARFHGTGAATQGGGVQALPSPEFTTAMALVLLVRHTTPGGHPVAKHATDPAAGPLFVESLAGGGYRVGVRTGQGAAFVDAASRPTGEWRWLAASWDGAELRLYAASINGADLTLEGAVPLAGTAVDTFAPWTFGGGFAGGVAAWGLWSAAKTAGELGELVGRILPAEEIEDDADLESYLDFEPGTGELAYDRKNGIHARFTESGWEWATTLEGGAELSGQLRPVTLGAAASVPLTFLGELGPGGDRTEAGRLYTCHAGPLREWQYLAAGWAPLAPEVDYTTPTGVLWDVDSGVMRLRSGEVPRVVPNQVVHIHFDERSANSPGVYTVDDVDFHGRRWIRIREPLADDQGVDRVQIRTDTEPATASKWRVVEGGAAVEIRGAVPSGELTAWVEGDDRSPLGYVDDVAGVLRYLVEEIGPQLDPADVDVDVDLGAAGARPASLHLPTGDGDKETAGEPIRQLLEAAGGHALAADGRTLRFARVDLTAAGPPAVELVAEEIEPGSLRRRGMGSPPSTSTVGYAPAWKQATEGELAADAWEPLAAVARRAHALHTEPNPAAVDYDLATEADPIPTPLAHRRDAVARARELNADSAAELWELTLTRRLPVELGDKVRLTHPRLERWRDGADGWVVGIPRLVVGAEENRMTLVLAVVP